MEDLLTGANIFTIFVGALVGIINVAITYLITRQNAKTEEKRLTLEGQRVDQDRDRSEVDAAERLTNTAGRLVDMSQGMADRLQNQINDLQAQLCAARERTTVLEKELSTVVAALKVAMDEAKKCPANGSLCPFLQPAFTALIADIERERKA